MVEQDFGKVVVLMGGDDAEREISLISGANVLKSLENLKINAIGIDAVDGFVEKLIAEKPDRVFIALHGPTGEGGSIQGLLDVLKIPYTGSGVLGSSIGMDKAKTKKIWQSLGLPTAPFCIWQQEKDLEEFIGVFGLPLAIKPVSEGSSIGISKLVNKEDSGKAYELAAKYGEVMIEQWISGEEFTVGILNGKALPVFNIAVEENFYDYTAKYNSKETKYISPGPITIEEEKFLQKIAIDAFNAVGAEYLGRVDFIKDLNGDFWLLEVNTVPGFTDGHSVVPMAAEKIGLSFDDLVVEILKTTLPKNFSHNLKELEKK